MQKYSDVVLDKNGKAIQGATVIVNTYPAGQPATIYAADGGPSVPSVLTDGNGRFAFYAASGHYSITVSGQGITPYTYNDVTLFDPKDLDAPGGFVRAVSVKQFGAKGDGVTDDTAAIRAAIAAFPNQGSPTWKPWELYFPTGSYLVTDTISIKNQQRGRIVGHDARLFGSVNGPILQIGDLSGNNDVLWFGVHGLHVENSLTTGAARAVVMQHAYSCTVRECFIAGGLYAFTLDGNNNQMTGTTFRAAGSHNVVLSGGANNVANDFITCASELAGGYGYYSEVLSGVGCFTNWRGGYAEACASGLFYFKNSQKFSIVGVYCNLQNGANGVTLDGTVGPSYPAGYGRVEQCDILGASGSTPSFIKELGSTSINVVYQDNRLESGNCDLYGSAQKSVNGRRMGKRIGLKNAVDFTDANADGIPDGWTRSGSSAATTGASTSPYGVGSTVNLAAGNYIYQSIKFPANALVRFSCYVSATGDDARVQVFSSGLGGAYKTAVSATSTPTRVEFYLTPADRSNATAAEFLLRHLGSTGVASFSDIEIEDMTN